MLISLLNYPGCHGDQRSSVISPVSEPTVDPDQCKNYVIEPLISLSINKVYIYIRVLWSFKFFRDCAI